MRGPPAHQNSACSPVCNQTGWVCSLRLNSKRVRPCTAKTRLPRSSCSTRYSPSRSANTVPSRVCTLYSLSASCERKRRPKSPLATCNKTRPSSSWVNSRSLRSSSHKLVEPMRRLTRERSSVRKRSPSATVWLRVTRSHSLVSASKSQASPMTSATRPARVGGSAQAGVAAAASSPSPKAKQSPQEASR